MMKYPLMAVVLLLSGLVMACTGTAESSTTVTVELHDDYLVPSETIIDAGQITFVATNVGLRPHELRISRFAADEGVPRELVGETEEIPIGESRSLTLALAPGEYEMACWLVEGEGATRINHYGIGERNRFTVR